MSLTLYGVPQSRAARCLWALEELGAPYEHVMTSFMGDNKQPDFLAINPNGRVPALKHGDLCLFESMAINLYLARTFGKGGLQPDDEQGAALATQWSFWAMTECEKGALTALFHAFGLGGLEKSEAKVQEQLKDLDRPFKVLDAALAGREWLVGDRFTVADLNVASVLQWAYNARLDLSAYPNLAGWLKRCFGRPANKKVGEIAKAAAKRG